jgi:hypothetical protein
MQQSSCVSIVQINSRFTTKQFCSKRNLFKLSSKCKITIDDVPADHGWIRCLKTNLLLVALLELTVIWELCAIQLQS